MSHVFFKVFSNDKCNDQASSDLLCNDVRVCGRGGCHRPGPGVNYMSVTTQSAADTLNLGISETLTTNVGQLPNGSWVNEIDVRLTSISGTYLGTDTIPSDASVVGFAGKWSFPGGGAYLSSTSSSGTKGINPLDGAYAGDPSDVPSLLSAPPIRCSATPTIPASGPTAISRSSASTPPAPRRASLGAAPVRVTINTPT